MPDYQQAAVTAGMILKEYDLCDYCLGRLFSRQMRLASDRLLGRRLKQGSGHGCHVCRGLFEHAGRLLDMIAETASRYSFSTFCLGAILRPSMMDRDDHIRSKYKLKGADGIKTGITRNLSKAFSKRVQKRSDCLNPDLTITLNLKDQSCAIRSKSVTMYGRYVKNARGISQKQKPCQNCFGRGCLACSLHGISGFDSVEGMISKGVFSGLGGTTAKFTWIGGEDKSSLVLGDGRPFFIRVKNPLRRDPELVAIQSDSVSVNGLRAVARPPGRPVAFESIIRIRVLAADCVDSESLRRLKAIPKSPVVVYDKSGRRSEKKIASLLYRKNSPDCFTVTVRAEGGLPVKRFVLGDDVSPGISQTLGIPCRCDTFDFLDIQTRTHPGSGQNRA